MINTTATTTGEHILPKCGAEDIVHHAVPFGAPEAFGAGILRAVREHPEAPLVWGWIHIGWL
jgi:hypothetical protein